MVYNAMNMPYRGNDMTDKANRPLILASGSPRRRELLGGIGLVVCVAVAYVASFLLREKGKDLKGLTLKTLDR